MISQKCIKGEQVYADDIDSLDSTAIIIENTDSLIRWHIERIDSLDSIQSEFLHHLSYLSALCTLVICQLYYSTFKLDC